MKECRRGNGIRLTASFLRSLFSWPGNRRQHVIPEIAADTRWFRSPYVGVVSLSVRKQMSYSASLSITITSSAFSTLVHGQRGVVGLDDGVGHLGRREHGEGAHHPVR